MFEILFFMVASLRQHRAFYSLGMKFKT